MLTTKWLLEERICGLWAAQATDTIPNLMPKLVDLC